jgi:hypothetical protein
MTKKLWFKNKRYGWGWTPASWEGWVTIAVYAVLLVPIVNNLIILSKIHPQFDSVILIAIGRVFLLTFALLIVSYYKGEKPSWHWNNK